MQWQFETVCTACGLPITVGVDLFADNPRDITDWSYDVMVEESDCDCELTEKQELFFAEMAYADALDRMADNAVDDIKDSYYDED